MRIAPLTPEDAAILDRLFVRRPHLVILSTRADAEDASVMAERAFINRQREQHDEACSCDGCRGDYVPAVCDADGEFAGGA